MEMTSRQKDKVGLQRYGLHGDDVEVLQEAKIINSNSPIKGEGVLSILICSYPFQSNDNGQTWTGPHLGKPDLDATFRRFCIVPEKIDPIKK